MEFFGDDIDYPFRLFELKKDFTLDELRSQYKKMVLRYHPDKNPNSIQNSKEFQVLTACYKYLLNLLKTNEAYGQGQMLYSKNDTYNNKSIEKDFFELKKNYDLQSSSYQPPLENPLVSKFNLEKFNQQFEKNKYHDPLSSKGYDDFINDPTTLDPVKMKGYGNGYDDIAEHADPVPLDGVEMTECYELGGKLQNLGRTHPLSTKLHYMDYKLAYTSPKIIDESKVVPRIEYTTLEQLNAERAKPINLNQKEISSITSADMKRKHLERERLMRLEKEQKDLQEYFERTQRILMR